MKKTIMLMCLLFVCYLLLAQTTATACVKNTQAAELSDSVTVHKGVSPDFMFALMVNAIESDYDEVCSDIRYSRIIAVRGGTHVCVDVVTGEETPAPEYDKKCSCRHSERKNVSKKRVLSQQKLIADEE